MDAVIFDMDGVLIDSYQAHYQSWASMAGRRGLKISEQQFQATFGRTSRESIVEYWGEGRFSEAEIKAMDLEKEADFRRIIAADFPAMPGAKDLIIALDRSGFAVAVGSSAPRENVDLAIDRLAVRAHLCAIVTGSDVQRGKPDPQIFLLAAERLAVPAAALCGSGRRARRHRRREGCRHGQHRLGQHRPHARIVERRSACC